MIEHMDQAGRDGDGAYQHDALRACWLGAWLRGFAVALEYGWSKREDGGQ